MPDSKRGKIMNRHWHGRWFVPLVLFVSATGWAADEPQPAPSVFNTATSSDPQQGPQTQIQTFARVTRAWGPLQLPTDDANRRRNLALPSPESANEAEAQRQFESEHVIVEGVRDSDERRVKPQTLEDQFAQRLSSDNPELIAGRYYKGSYYDGTLFYGSDPLSFVFLNFFKRPGG